MEIKEKIWQKVDRVEKVREFKDLTKGDTAGLIGVSRATYYNWLNRDTLPDWSQVEKINKFLNKYDPESEER